MANEYEVVNTVSLEMHRDAAESHSDSLESGLTVESSRGDADSKKLDECGGWTNEKHNLYLDSLENSFVKQLYSLLGVGGETQRLTRTRGVQSNSHKLTDQFTVLQNGYRQKFSFGKKRAHLETMGTDKGFTRTSMRTSLVHQYPAQSTAEASGQNFREEVEEKGCDSEVSRKRRRGANYDDSSLNDQVVP
ncbi:hypothetical protein IGI04_000393 [Brassica rapa subsp. trilocularis]|uniref:Uncharacterized protein n=1 Tax=Brassica rapa subsp. trilocularis TaxID=1813537 RepID=A0ABQ7NQL3_BRACM|nr:hypothetical protein IGI04_000393 [Brassica rapa subsp. trilocularis]